MEFWLVIVAIALAFAYAGWRTDRRRRATRPSSGIWRSTRDSTAEADARGTGPFVYQRGQDERSSGGKRR